MWTVETHGSSVLQLCAVETHDKVELEKGQGKQRKEESTEREEAKLVKAGGRVRKRRVKRKDSKA